jgi:lysine 2,3-aminomutase
VLIIDRHTDLLQLRNTVTDKFKLQKFLSETLPDTLGPSGNSLLRNIQHRQAFIDDAVTATKLAPMAIRLTPHILSRVDWANPLDDPIRKQFIPLASGIVPDNEHLSLDSLHEEEDSRTFERFQMSFAANHNSAVPGLVHRYPGRALFLGKSPIPYARLFRDAHPPCF